jgi:WD40 repeat protein
MSLTRSGIADDMDSQEPMKALGENRSSSWRVIASTLLIILPGVAFPQGRPDIIWAKGGHSNSVNSVVYSPDGQLLASGSSDRTIKVWRQDATFIKSLAIPYDSNSQLTDVRSVAISPDGTLIAAGVEQYNASTQTEFGAVQLWRIVDGELVRNFTGYGQAVNSVAFSPDGQYLASGSSDRSVKVWQVANGTLVSSRFDHTQRVNAVAFSPNGQWLASGSDDQTAKLYRTSDWGVERTLTGHSNQVLSVAFSPDSTRLATGSWDQTVRLWNVSDGNLAFSLPHGSGVGAVAFSPDGKTLATGTWDHNIRLWDPKRGVLVDTLLGHNAFVQTLAFAPDSRTLASGSWYPEYAIKLWQPPSWRASAFQPPTVTNHSSSISDLIFTATARLISGGDSTARYWDRSNGRFLSTTSATASVTTMALSPNGQLLALPGADNTVKIYRVPDGALLQTLVGHTDYITGLAFSHDGTLLASGAFFNGTNDAIKLWNVSNWTLMRELTGQFIFGPFIAINFSADDTLISATCEGTPAVWRVSDGTFIRSFAGGGQLTRFSPDGTLLAVASNPVRVYRTSDWTQVAALADQNQALAFTPDGHYLTTAGTNLGDGQIQFWRVSDWSLQRFYNQELGYAYLGISSLAFSADGSRFAYGRMDAVVAVATNPFPPKASRYFPTRSACNRRNCRSDNAH